MPYTFNGIVFTEPSTEKVIISKIDGSCDSIIYHATVSIITSLTYDGYEYPVIKIGSDCWFAENLHVTEGLNDVGAYNEDETNVELFGRLYNWYDAIGEAQPQGAKATTTTTAVGACPDGWRFPVLRFFSPMKKRQIKLQK